MADSSYARRDAATRALCDAEQPLAATAHGAAEIATRPPAMSSVGANGALTFPTSSVHQASEDVKAARKELHKLRSETRSEMREREARLRESQTSLLGLVIARRRAHLKLAHLFRSTDELSVAVEIEDGTRAEPGEVDRYIRTVSEALVARASSHR